MAFRERLLSLRGRRLYAPGFPHLVRRMCKTLAAPKAGEKATVQKGKTPERVAALNVAAHKRKHRKPFSRLRQFRTDGCLWEPTPEGYGEPLFPIFNGRTENGRFRGVGLNSQPGVTLPKAYRVPGSQPMGFQRARRPFGRAAAASKSAAVFRFLFGGKKEHPSPLYRKRIPFPVTLEKKIGVRGPFTCPGFPAGAGRGDVCAFSGAAVLPLLTGQKRRKSRRCSVRAETRPR